MRKRYKAAIVFVVLAGLWVATAPFLADALVLEKQLAKADAILVLSGSSEYIDRTNAAAKAYKAGVAPKILLTNDGRQGGWVESEKRNLFFAERAYDELIRQGVPGNAIETLPEIVRGTDDEATLVVPIAVERRMNSILLVTSSYHSRRALWTFERSVKKNSTELAFGVLTPDEGFGNPHRMNWWLSFAGWRNVGAEYVKFAYYWLFY